MKIISETQLHKDPVAFVSGKGGAYHHKYRILLCAHDTGVTISVSGHYGKDDAISVFYLDGEAFDTAKAALEFAGHEWCLG